MANANRRAAWGREAGPGHTAAEAEAWAACCDSWAAASDKAIDAFAIACSRLYAEIAREDPQPWKQRLTRLGTAPLSGGRPGCPGQPVWLCSEDMIWLAKAATFSCQPSSSGPLMPVTRMAPSAIFFSPLA